jgi:hypothetical protein
MIVSADFHESGTPPLENWSAVADGAPASPDGAIIDMSGCEQPSSSSGQRRVHSHGRRLC